MANGQTFKSDGEQEPGTPIDHDAIRATYRKRRQPPAPAPAEEDGSTPTPSTEAAASDVDLEAWARGEEDYNFDDLAKAIDDWALDRVRDLASRTVRVETPHDALEFLIEQGVIDENDARMDL